MSWTSPITALSHLSDEAVAAFADGVLGDTARQRAQSHMVECAECSEAVYGQRAARAALRSALSPRLPAGLFERLRELPITAELPFIQLPAGLSSDGQPMYAATGVIEPASAVVAPVRPTIEPFPTPVPAGRQALVAEAAHRRASARFGLGATAVAVLAVGVLATTAANAGGVVPLTNSTRPAGDGPGYHRHQSAITSGTSTVVKNRLYNRLDSGLRTTVDAPMQMTLLSVPSSGR